MNIEESLMNNVCFFLFYPVMSNQIMFHHCSDFFNAKTTNLMSQSTCKFTRKILNYFKDTISKKASYFTLTGFQTFLTTSSKVEQFPCCSLHRCSHNFANVVLLLASWSGSSIWSTSGERSNAVMFWWQSSILSKEWTPRGLQKSFTE